MTTITFRTDGVIDSALKDLMGDRADRSQAIRDAILTAWRLRQDQVIRAEATALAEDPVDVAEARSVLSDMEAVRAW
jgi:hypothetical protein